MSGIVDFTQAEVGDEAYAYVDMEGQTEHWCVFQLDYFDDVDRPVRLRRQRWLLLAEDVIVVGEITPEEEDPNTSQT